jgi:hypothetical protein
MEKVQRTGDSFSLKSQCAGKKACLITDVQKNFIEAGVSDTCAKGVFFLQASCMQSDAIITAK